MSKALYDAGGKLLGQIEQSGDISWLYSADGTLLGQYDSSSNFTYDAHGNLVGAGNLLGMLLR